MVNRNARIICTPNKSTNSRDLFGPMTKHPLPLVPLIVPTPMGPHPFGLADRANSSNVLDAVRRFWRPWWPRPRRSSHQITPDRNRNRRYRSSLIRMSRMTVTMISASRT